MKTVTGVLELSQFQNKANRTNWGVMVNKEKVGVVFNLEKFANVKTGDNVTIEVDESKKFPEIVSVVSGGTAPATPSSSAPKSSSGSKAHFEYVPETIRIQILPAAVALLNNYYDYIKKGGSVLDRTTNLLMVAKTLEGYVKTGEIEAGNLAAAEIEE